MLLHISRRRNFHCLRSHDRSSKNTYGDGVLVEDNVVGEASVVHPGDALASLDGHCGGHELQSTAVCTELDGGISERCA